MRRRGINVFSIVSLNTVITATMVASIVLLAVQAVQSVQKKNMKGLAEIDRHRFINAITGISGTGTGSAVLFFNNEYDTIEINGGTATMSVASVDKTMEIQLPDQYDYTGAASGRQICIMKQGLQYRLYEGSCNRPSCTDGACVAHTRQNADGDTRATWGYQCKNNVLTDEEFFSHYYSSGSEGCDARSGSFIAINRIACPDVVVDRQDKESGIQVSSSCSVVASWRCSGSTGDVTLRLDIRNRDSNTRIRSGSRSLSCNGGIQHGRFSLHIPDVSEISGLDKGYAAVGRVILPSTQASEQTRFGVRSRNDVTYPGVS